MTLDQTLKLEAVLAANVSTTQPETHVVYVDWQPTGLPAVPTPFRSTLNNSTDVTILAAPTFAKSREITYLSLYNKDVTSATLTLKTDDAAASTERIITKQTLTTGQSLVYEKGAGWQII